MIVKQSVVVLVLLIGFLGISEAARWRGSGSKSSGSRWSSGSRGSHSSSSSSGGIFGSSSHRGNSGSSIFGSNNHHTTSLSYPTQKSSHGSSSWGTHSNPHANEHNSGSSGSSSFGSHNPTQNYGWKPTQTPIHTQTHANPYQTPSHSKPFQTPTNTATSSSHTNLGYGSPKLPNSGSTVQQIGWNVPNDPGKNSPYPTLHQHGQITKIHNTHSAPYPTQNRPLNHASSPVPSAPPASFVNSQAPNIGWKVTPTNTGGTSASTTNHGLHVS